MQQRSEMLSIGQRVEIGVASKDRVDWLPSRIEDDPAGDRLTVAWPTDSERQLVYLTVGASLELAASARDAMYAASAVVEQACHEGVPMLKLRLQGEWRRSQRRNAVRASVAVRPRVADCVYGEARRPMRLGVTNVSASGVRVRSQDELRRGDLLELAFELDGEIVVRARVRRVFQREHIWEAGCEFEGVSKKVTERIVQFIFAQQRAMLRLQRGDK